MFHKLLVYSLTNFNDYLTKVLINNLKISQKFFFICLITTKYIFFPSSMEFFSQNLFILT